MVNYMLKVKTNKKNKMNMQKKIFSLLVLLMTAVSGAWADTVVTWNNINGGTQYTQDGVTFTCSDYDDEYKYFVGPGTFTTDLGNFTKIEITAYSMGISGDGWTGDEKHKTWTGNAASVPFTSDIMVNWEAVTFKFTIVPAPAATTNYYLVGTMNDWGASKQFLLTPNPDNAAEYMISLNLKAGAEFKVIGVGETTTWYPDGDNYGKAGQIDADGKYTIYFRPDGQGGDDWYYHCIYVQKPAIPVTDLGDGQWQFEMPDYAVVAKIEYDTELELQEENVNTAVLADWHGYEADITLQRTLKAGSWNTLAVPFNVSSQMLTYLTSTYGMQVKQLASTSLSGETILLNFSDASEMVAGTPYLVKVTTDYDFSARALPNVEVSQELNPVETEYADFIPTLGKTLVTGPSGNESNTEAVLFVAANNTLVNPTVVNAPDQKSSYIKGFRAYFQLKNVPAEARSIALNLGDESTGIESLTTSPMAEGSTYDLQGRKVNANVNKGVYIMNGKKVIK